MRRSSQHKLAYYAVEGFGQVKEEHSDVQSMSLSGTDGCTCLMDTETHCNAAFATELLCLQVLLKESR